MFSSEIAQALESQKHDLRSAMSRFLATVISCLLVLFLISTDAYIQSPLSSRRTALRLYSAGTGSGHESLNGSRRMTLSLIGTTIGASIFAPTTALALDADTEASMRRM